MNVRFLSCRSRVGSAALGLLLALCASRNGHAAPPQLGSGVSEPDAVRVVRGRFVDVVGRRTPLRRLSAGHDPGATQLHSVDLLGLFESSIDNAHGDVQATRWLVDLTIADSNSPSMMWINAESSLALVPSREGARRAADLGVTPEVAAWATVPTLFVVAGNGHFGVAEWNPNTPPYQSQTLAIAPKTMASLLGESGGPLPEGLSFGSWQILQREAVSQRLLRLEGQELAPISRAPGKSESSGFDALLHPQHASPSVILFWRRRDGLAPATGSGLPAEYPVLAVWPDGTLLKQIASDSASGLAYAQGRCRQSELANLLGVFCNERRRVGTQLFGIERAPHGAMTSVSVIGFGEPIRMDVDLGLVDESGPLEGGTEFRRPLTAACSTLLEKLRAIPLSEPIVSNATTWTRCEVQLPVRAR